ncbi:hypothetical protein [Tunturiibacter gelidiferens]|uniref:Ferritin-like diiron domain-containing protein n=1 Tax=Tunturiibacter gelidiferens TaxID=3069689 RepID=A0AAU7Z5U8_9BACT
MNLALRQALGDEPSVAILKEVIADEREHYQTLGNLISFLDLNRDGRSRQISSMGHGDHDHDHD